MRVRRNFKPKILAMRFEFVDLLGADCDGAEGCVFFETGVGIDGGYGSVDVRVRSYVGFNTGSESEIFAGLDAEGGGEEEGDGGDQFGHFWGVDGWERSE